MADLSFKYSAVDPALIRLVAAERERLRDRRGLLVREGIEAHRITTDRDKKIGEIDSALIVLTALARGSDDQPLSENEARALEQIVRSETE